MRKQLHSTKSSSNTVDITIILYNMICVPSPVIPKYTTQTYGKKKDNLKVYEAWVMVKSEKLDSDIHDTVQ